MRKPSNTLLEAMDQMEQIPGIAGVWSEVRCQTRHTKPMRKMDWAFITSSGWLYVNTEREASCPEWVYILSHCCLHLALGHIREDWKTDAVWEHACDCIASKMLLDLRIGRQPAEFAEAPPANAKEETAFYHWLLEHPTAKIPRFATMTDGRTGMIFDWLPSGQDWAQLFAEDLQWSIRQTLRGCADGQTARPCTCRPATGSSTTMWGAPLSITLPVSPMCSFVCSATSTVGQKRSFLMTESYITDVRQSGSEGITSLP